MRLDKLTTKFQEALADAQSLALGNDHAYIDPLHLLAAMPPLPGGLNPRALWLEFDTTPNSFRDDLLAEPLDIQRQVARDGSVKVPDAPGLGVVPDAAFLTHYAVP